MLTATIWLACLAFFLGLADDAPLIDPGAEL